MAGVFPHKFADFIPGSRLNVVAKLLCWDGSHDAHLFVAKNDKTQFLAKGLIDGSNEVYTFMNACLQQQYPVPVLEPPSSESLHAVIEMCSGFGGIS